jgi:hypothetical protein
MIKDCPYCFRKILLKPDGSCPACGSAGADQDTAPSRALVAVGPKTRLPCLCWHCSAPATAVVGQDFSNDQQGIGADLKQLAVSQLPFYAFFKAFHDANHRIAFRLAMPVCARCAHQPLRVESLDLMGRSARFVVHPEFAAATDRIRHTPEHALAPSPVLQPQRPVTRWIDWFGALGVLAIASVFVLPSLHMLVTGQRPADGEEVDVARDALPGLIIGGILMIPAVRIAVGCWRDRASARQ